LKVVLRPLQIEMKRRPSSTPLSSQIFSGCYNKVMPYACRRISRISTCLHIFYDIGSRRWSLEIPSNKKVAIEII
jgi:hypothetical protein